MTGPGPDEFYCQSCGRWRKGCKLVEEHCSLKAGEDVCYEVWNCPDGHGIEVLS